MLYKYAASAPRQLRNALAGKYLFIFFMSFAVFTKPATAMGAWALLALPAAIVWAAFWYRDARRLRAGLERMASGGVSLDSTGINFVGLFDGAKLPFSEVEAFSVRRPDGPKNVIFKRKGKRPLRLYPLEDTDAFVRDLRLYLHREEPSGFSRLWPFSD